MRTRIMFWLHTGRPIGWLLEMPNWLADPALWVIDRFERQLCAALGHEPERGQCGRPEHDLCRWCQKLMPHQAARRA